MQALLALVLIAAARAAQGEPPRSTSAAPERRDELRGFEPGFGADVPSAIDPAGKAHAKPA